MEEFSSATATSIIQEFYINILLSNLVSLIKNDADEEIDITSKSSNKFRYQANRAFIIGRIKIIFPKILCDLSELSVIEKLYKEAVRCRSQILPGRSFPRKKLKSKGRSHFRNKKAALPSLSISMMISSRVPFFFSLAIVFLTFCSFLLPIAVFSFHIIQRNMVLFRDAL